MSQRWIAFAVAAPLAVVLLLLAALVPLPYAVHSPGPTFDVLSTDVNDAEIIQVDGHRTYRDDGQIRFTTVQTSPYGEKQSLFAAMAAWVDPDRAVIPYDVAHPPDVTQEEDQVRGAVSMVSSQDKAVAVALEELDHDVEPVVQVAHVDEDGAAHGELRVRDHFVKVDGEPVEDGEQIVEAVESHGPGDPVALVMERDGKRLEVDLEPKKVDGAMRIGVSLGIGYDFPFDVSITVDPSIGGPSAGLMFSLAVYDTLTPGSLTDGAIIAGTGELSADGSVGPISGIQQKIAGSEDAGAELFFVPPDNCGDVSGLDPDLELVRADTMKDALRSLETWTADRDADLPRC